MSWGWLQGSWLPGALITQRFESVAKVAKIHSPLLVVHGANDPDPGLAPGFLLCAMRDRGPTAALRGEKRAQTQDFVTDSYAHYVPCCGRRVIP